MKAPTGPESDQIITSLRARGYLRKVETEQAVKSGAEQSSAASRLDSRACGRRSHHEGPGEQVAYSGGRAPAPPQPSDQREREKMRSFSKGFAVPIENDYICGTVVLLRQEDGRLRAQRVDCRVKACPKCGPRLREEWARLWTQVLAGEVVHRLVVDDEECAKLLRRKVMRGHQYGVIPAPDGQRVIYTTAAIGKLVADLPEAMTSDFEAMPNDTRQRSLSAGWQYVAWWIEALAASICQTEPFGAPRKVEFVGILRAGLEHARQLAREFGIYEEEAGRDGSAFIFRQPDDPLTWSRFKRWAGLDEPGERKGRRRRRPKLKAVAA